MTQGICIGILLINLSGDPINELDKKHIEFAKVRCEQKYPDSPCLSKFIKVRKQIYRVLCGPTT